MRAHIYNKVDEERTRQLLDRFMQGATTLDEEQWLADQLRDCNREEWSVYREMFAWFEQGMTDSKAPEKHSKVRQLARWWRQIAAVAILVVVAGIGWEIATKSQLTGQNIAPAKHIEPKAVPTEPKESNVAGGLEQQTVKTAIMASSGRKQQSITPNRNLPTSTVMTATGSDSPTIDLQEEGRILAEVLTEQVSEREELRRELRNNFVETVFTRLPDEGDALQLVMDESGDYQIVPPPSPVEL